MTKKPTYTELELQVASLGKQLAQQQEMNRRTIEKCTALKSELSPIDGLNKINYATEDDLLTAAVKKLTIFMNSPNGRLLLVNHSDAILKSFNFPAGPLLVGKSESKMVLGFIKKQTQQIIYNSAPNNNKAKFQPLTKYMGVQLVTADDIRVIAFFWGRSADYAETDATLISSVLEALWNTLFVKRLMARLEQKSTELEKTDITLKVLLERRNLDIKQLQKNVISSVETNIMPLLVKMRNWDLLESQKPVLDLLQNNLKELFSPFSAKLVSRLKHITPREMAVANFVRSGKTSDEIADVLGVSKSAVIFHRQNLRVKLGLKGKKKGLQSYLLDTM
ncbi:LuxR C-terminal-related transcriptional regulator [Desulfobacterales bacterium HSG17]|nr:LuxR C-terminal-related transcriptional regulator [Desulfobacterales bacterium HSG17]